MTDHVQPQPQPARAIEKLNPRQAFARAVVLQREGQPAEAEKLYQGILQLDPNHADALHNLGIIRIQQGKADEAVVLIRRAVELNPGAANPRNDLGMALAMLRRFEEAVAHYRKALEIKPDFIGARSNLANTLIALKRSDEAIAQFEEALAAQPQSPELHSNVGNALSALGRHEEAVAAYRAALAIRADFAEAHNNLGTALAALGRVGQAEAHYTQAIALKPDYADPLRNLGKSLLGRRRPQLALPHLARALELKADADAHNDLGNAFAMLERHREAIAQYEQALVKSPGFAAAHNNLGNALTTIGRHEEAVVHLRRAIALAPDYPEALSNLGNALLSLHRVEEAVPCLERALTLRPTMAQAHNGLGSAMQALGRLDEARQAFEQAVALAPENAAYYHQLGTVKRYSPGDPHLLAMQALARDMEALPPSERISLHFALGKAFADLGEHERAFRHYVEGNALHRAGITYDETLTLTGFDRLKQVFTAELIRARAGGGDPSDLPVFIVGMPRSGTTLVEQILASHPQVFAGGELRDLGRLVGSIRRRDGARGFPEMVPHMSDAQLRAFGSAYVDAVRQSAPPCARITDKMPGNFYFAGLLRLALPNARIVHVRRDPVDTCLSLFMHLFVGELTWTDDLGEIGRYYRAYASLMEHWRAVLPPGAMLEVQYEDLVADLESQARRLVAYCGLAWDERCLSFYEAKRPVWTASLAQVRQPIYRSAIGRSRPYLPMLGPLLEALGDRA
jgi:tetratricopeptide (TPR) repeat protein